ncbi:class I SAM-dependent methyltransferase [Methylomonas sp. HYX-M1]|uniref:class I SAM-dependent methyltransferase n=1 Tax=Methylomonas sp. HYX-M1 TaxID=3139307 RepID=UPI00345BF21C
MQNLSDELAHIEASTLQHYNQNAESYWQGTQDHDVSQNYTAFLDALPAGKSLDILDLGCGPGRDVKHFRALGHNPVGLDGSEAFCRMARAYTACSIWHQSFLNLDLPQQRFDGIFANASLFHVPRIELPRVLMELHAALRAGGVLFMSNPRGSGEGWSGQRYGYFVEFETGSRYLADAGFDILSHYYRPAGKPRHEQPWLAIVARKA